MTIEFKAVGRIEYHPENQMFRPFPKLDQVPEFVMMPWDCWVVFVASLGLGVLMGQTVVSLMVGIVLVIVIHRYHKKYPRGVLRRVLYRLHVKGDPSFALINLNSRRWRVK